MDDQTAATPSSDSAEKPVEGAAAAPQPGPAADTSGAAPHKRRVWPWILGGVVALVLAGGGYFAWTVVQAQQLADARAAAAVDAEKHWEAAMKSLATIPAKSESLANKDAWSGARQMPELVKALESMQASAGKELDATEKAVALLPEGAAKAEYTNAIKDAREAIAKALEAAPILKELPDFYQNSADADRLYGSAREHLHKGVKAGNARKWDLEITNTRKAIDECNRAERILKKTKAALKGQSAIDDDGAIGDAIKVIAVERRMAQSALAAAQAGKIGSVSQYDTAVDRYNAGIDAASKLGVPLIFRDPGIFAAEAQIALKAAANKLTDAQNSHDKALRASLEAAQ